MQRRRSSDGHGNRRGRETEKKNRKDGHRKKRTRRKNRGKVDMQKSVSKRETWRK